MKDRPNKPKFTKFDAEFKKGLVKRWVEQLDNEEFIIVYFHLKYDRRLDLSSENVDPSGFPLSERQVVAKVIYRELYEEHKVENFEAIITKLRHRKVSK